MPSSRRSDPQTSRDAAASLTLPHISELHQRILSIVRTHGPVSDTAIEALFTDKYWPWVPTGQSLRSRRSELVKLGKLRPSSEFGETPSGRKTQKWEAVE